MKTKLLVLLLLAGCSLFARTHVFVGIGLGDPAYGYYPPPPPPPVVYAPPCPGPDYTWVPGYWYPAGPRYHWRAGYWAPPAYYGGFSYYGGWGHGHSHYYRGHHGYGGRWHR